MGEGKLFSIVDYELVLIDKIPLSPNDAYHLAREILKELHKDGELYLFFGEEKFIVIPFELLVNKQKK